MTETADKYRAGQAADFDRNDIAEDDPLRKVVTDVYDAADKLNEDQSGIYVMNAVSTAIGAIEHTIEHTDHPAVRTQLILAVSLLSTAGYVIEQSREVAGFTSTDDKKVEAVYQAVKAMVRATSTHGMDDVTREKTDAVSKAVGERLRAGDTTQIDKLIAEEVEKVGGIDGVSFEVEGHDSGPGADMKVEEDPADYRGLYL